MGFLDDEHASRLAYRMDALIYESETNRGGHEYTYPVPFIQMMHRIEAKLDALLSNGATRADEVARLINMERVANSCSAALPDARLTRAAHEHSQWMYETNTFSHTGRGGSSFSDRIAATLYPASASGEILSVGHTTAEGAVDGWMASTPHRDILLNCNYTNIGVGIAGNYYTVLFATP